MWAVLAGLGGGGCLTTGAGGFGGGGDDIVGGDSDADTDVDTDVDSDADTDTDSDSGGACPAYPDSTGYQIGDVVPDFAMPGNGPDDEWSMNDFWCMAHQAESPITVLLINVHSLT